MKRLLLLLILLVIAAALLALLWRLFSGQTPTRAEVREDARANGPPEWPLFVLPLPAAAAALIALVRGQLGLLVGDVLGYGLMLGGALLIRRALADGASGMGAAAWWRRWPPKTIGAVLVALGSGVTAWLGAAHHPGIAVAFTAVTLLGLHFVYGLDLSLPRRPEGMASHGAVSLRRAARSIAAIEQASRSIQQPELDARLTGIAGLAREIIQRVQDDPRDLWRARKFLNVYLDGTQRVVEGYARTHGQVAAPELDQRFRHALETVEHAFREQRQVLLERDVEDLDVQIEVLTRQLEREGIL